MVDLIVCENVGCSIDFGNSCSSRCNCWCSLRYTVTKKSCQKQTDLILRLFATFNSNEFLKTWIGVLKRDAKDFDDYEKKYGWVEALEVGMFIEGIGVLLKRKLIDIDLVDDLFTESIKITWENGASDEESKKTTRTTYDI
jgi:hypothetical protein